jgi:hypothetical protein
LKVSLPPMPIYSTTRRRSRSRGLASTGSTRGCPQSARAGGWVRPPVATWRNWRRSAPASLSTLPMRRDAGDRRRCVTCVPLLTGALVSSRVPQAEAIYRAERFQIDTAVREATRAADAAWATLAAARGGGRIQTAYDTNLPQQRDGQATPAELSKSDIASAMLSAFDPYRHHNHIIATMCVRRYIVMTAAWSSCYVQRSSVSMTFTSASPHAAVSAGPTRLSVTR